MRILVTGANGFVGSHLVSELRNSGHNVFGTDRASGEDIADGHLFHQLVAGVKPDYVVHLAARYGRLPCENLPLDALHDNVQATTVVARACGEYRIPVLYASSSEVYGDHGTSLITEESDCVPHNLYGATKKWGEELFRLYQPETAIARLNMLYGPGQLAGPGLAALPNIIQQARQRLPIPIHIGSERSWLHITDAVRALRMLIEYQCRGVWNVSHDSDSRWMRDIAALVCKLTDAPESLIVDENKPARQTLVKRISSEKMRRLGWTTRVTLEDGVKELV